MYLCEILSTRLYFSIISLLLRTFKRIKLLKFLTSAVIRCDGKLCLSPTCFPFGSLVVDINFYFSVRN